MEKKVYEYIYSKSGEKIVEWKKCSCSEEFPITDKDLAFYEKISPTFNGNKYLIPAPTLCPDCRLQRRLAWRNERKLYKRKSDASNKDIVSLYSPDKPYKVYEQSEWWSDSWDAIEYGIDYDFSKSFFEQFEELSLKVPKIGLNSGNDNENCDYNNYISGSKNCYLNFGISNSENTLYSYQSSNLTNSLEVYNSSDVSNSGYVEYSSNIHKSLFVWNSNNISQSFFMKGCENVSNGIFCANISNKKYVFKNKEITKEEYNKKLSEVKQVLALKNGVEILQKEFELFLKETFSVKQLNNSNIENSFGNNLANVKDCKISYSVVNSNNCQYTTDAFLSSDCFDTNLIGNNADNLFDVINVFGSSNVLFSESVFEGSKNIFYSQNCTNGSSDLFGCIGLKSKKICILNKQYTKSEYEELVPKIIEKMISDKEWGEFFPASLSPFGYNETVASEYFPLSRDEIISPPSLGGAGGGIINNLPHLTSPNLGEGKSQLIHGPVFKYSTYETPFPKVEKNIPASKLPNDISTIPDDVLNWAIECETSNKPFRITKMELDFYRTHFLPLPTKHPDIRHLDRMNKRTPRKLHLRNCDKCGIEMISVYNKENEYKIYCEDCYNKEVY